MIRSCVIDFGINQEKYLPLAEFAYKNSHHVSLRISPFEELYGRRCRSPTYWLKLSERKIIGLDLVRKMEEKLSIIRTHLETAQDHQKAYADRKRKDIWFELGDNVFF